MYYNNDPPEDEITVEDAKEYLRMILLDYQDPHYWKPDSTNPEDVWNHSIDIWVYDSYYRFMVSHPEITDFPRMESLYIAKMREFYEDVPEGKIKEAYRQALDMAYVFEEQLFETYR